jgi:beta-lactamase superfamily II metal-dependent hydrolase
MDLIPPKRDEFEVSVFGRGYGEAVCIHLGDDAWALIDSCINPQSRSPAALSYLDGLGLSPAEVVRLVIATHWDDDHIRGIGEIVDACNSARVACSAALRRPDILAFVVQQEAAGGALGSGLDEFRRVLRTCHERGVTILWAKANLPLHPLPPGYTPRVVALSPSEDAFERSIESLIEAATAARSTLPRRYRAPEGPNGGSVATSVRLGEHAVLAGADLEVSANKETGWDAVLAYSKPPVKASLVKVPHHGSAGAHLDAMWRELAEDDPVAVVAPWSRGAKYLPTQADLSRLRSVAGKLLLTATPRLRRSRKDHELEKMIRQLHGGRISELTGWGHVRARIRSDEHVWRIELDGDATAVA